VTLRTAGQDNTTSEQYPAYRRTVAQQFALQIKTYEEVVGIRALPGGGGFAITTRRSGAEHHYQAQRIVLATGGTATPRRLNVPGEDLPHVHPHSTDAHDYFAQRVLVIGGK